MIQDGTSRYWYESNLISSTIPSLPNEIKRKSLNLEWGRNVEIMPNKYGVSLRRVQNISLKKG